MFCSLQSLSPPPPPPFTNSRYKTTRVFVFLVNILQASHRRMLWRFFGIASIILLHGCHFNSAMAATLSAMSVFTDTMCTSPAAYTFKNDTCYPGQITGGVSRLHSGKILCSGSYCEVCVYDSDTCVTTGPVLSLHIGCSCSVLNPAMKFSFNGTRVNSARGLCTA